MPTPTPWARWEQGARTLTSTIVHSTTETLILTQVMTRVVRDQTTQTVTRRIVIASLTHQEVQAGHLHLTSRTSLKQSQISLSLKSQSKSLKTKTIRKMTNLNLRSSPNSLSLSQTSNHSSQRVMVPITSLSHLQSPARRAVIVKRRKTFMTQ